MRRGGGGGGGVIPIEVEGWIGIDNARYWNVFALGLGLDFAYTSAFARTASCCALVTLGDNNISTDTDTIVSLLRVSSRRWRL